MTDTPGCLRPADPSTVGRRGALLVLLAAAGAAHAHGDAHGPKAQAAAPKQQAWGAAGQAAAAKRTVTLRMLDTMRFVPDRVDVRLGETVRFVVRNEGRVLHEFVIGTPGALEEHAALMAKFPDMQHDEPWMTHVPPGKTGQVLWAFNRAGEFAFACLVAGHYQAGMRGTIRVEPRP